jgi:uncharacterized protein (DUF1697 family)
MPATICLLRSVNVGGRNKVAMAELRAICRDLGLGDPRTYVQSGNVVFQTGQTDLPALAVQIAAAIERRCGFAPDIFLRTVIEMKAVVASNPFAGRAGIEPNKLLVCFLAAELPPEGRKALAGLPETPEEVYAGKRELYVYYPNGIGQARLSTALLERTLKMNMTGRNWNSVTKLLEMAESGKSAQ